MSRKKDQIERVAIALFIHERPNNRPWETTHASTRKKYRELAAVAIGALK